MKRLRVDGNSQYREISGQFSHFNADPQVEHVQREPLREDLDAVVIGGGFGGMLAAVWLQDAGISKIRIIEKAGDFGGTWYWNRYPALNATLKGTLSAPARGDRLYPQGAVLFPAREGREVPRWTKRSKGR